MKRQGGQVLPIAAAAFLVMCALAGLAIDSSRDYLIKRQAQNAADFAALAASKQMAQQLSLSSPLATGSNAVKAAHDYAANNGFNTIYNTTCDQPGPGTFTTTWFDVTGLACGATSGFTNKVTLNSPAENIPGAPVPTVCTGKGADSCVQVVITAQIGQLFTAVLGISRAYVTVAATSQAVLPSSAFDAPPPIAVSLYQPQTGCVPAAQQCFDETKPVGRSQLSCTGAGNNCPTFWAGPSTSPKIYGYDGSVLNTPTHYTAMQSNGDMVIQDRTTVCDPYGGATCGANSAIGASGWAIPAGAKDYCNGNTGAVSTPCTNSGQASLSRLYGNQAGFSSPVYWYPTVDASNLHDCGSLILNGQAVYGPCANAQDPYTIGNGIYDYIVINHGSYEFGPGLYDITSKAPVNNRTGAGYTANGIDHSQETAAGDFDLCTGGQPNSCPNLTAGVWIGNGRGSFAPYQGPTGGSCTNGVAGSGGGGGGPTIVSGSGVVFRFEPGSLGFVSTNEVQALSLAGAGVGAVSDVSGSPLLFDMENSGWIHIDAQAGAGGGNGIPPNTTSGIIYQTPNATGGGVEFDPSMAGFDTLGNELAAVQGQVLAYSLTTFGGSGGTLNFTQGYGGGSVPSIGTSGRDETSIIGAVTLQAGAPGFSVLTVNYTDEYMMDAYDVYVKVNNGNPQFFSQGIWSPAPGPGSPLPPPANNPGDANPIYPPAASSGSYTVISQSGINYDYLYTIPSGSGATIEAKGNWVWGHQNDPRITGNFNGNNSGSYTGKLIYTFPNPAGNYLQVTVFLLDGDRCGDYAYATYTFQSTGGPGPGQQSQGSVSLVQ
ncbi:MAG TPA: pilus assembly protein TadG-related protein [Candidatus Dormibacteraeota bacterium]|nr:pilus assembly protein TadG-related protein [Candidatus Dormibacteraeota bacterium]